jgi:hypothetical protein
MRLAQTFAFHPHADGLTVPLMAEENFIEIFIASTPKFLCLGAERRAGKTQPANFYVSLSLLKINIHDP